MNTLIVESKAVRPRAWAGIGMIAGLALNACAFSPEARTVEKTVTVTASPSSDPREPGACEPFGVYAQNRWAPVGAAERNEPHVLARKIGGYAGNEVVVVDGWRDTEQPVYPSNPAPWNSSVWLHTAEGGWVSFAAVRQEPTELDPTSRNPEGGMPVSLTPDCEM